METTDLEYYTQLLTGIPEIDIKIINELTNKDLFRFCQVNKYARELCQTDYLWQVRIASRYGEIDENQKI